MGGEEDFRVHTPGAAGQHLEYLVSLVHLILDALVVVLEG